MAMNSLGPQEGATINKELCMDSESDWATKRVDCLKKFAIWTQQSTKEESTTSSATYSSPIKTGQELTTTVRLFNNKDFPAIDYEQLEERTVTGFKQITAASGSLSPDDSWDGFLVVSLIALIVVTLSVITVFGILWCERKLKKRITSPVRRSINKEPTLTNYIADGGPSAPVNRSDSVITVNDDQRDSDQLAADHEMDLVNQLNDMKEDKPPSYEMAMKRQVSDL